MAQVLKKEKREKIYQAAVEEFYKNGYNLTKMKNIAHRADVPTGLIYSYFKNKNNLFEAVVSPTYEEIKYFLKNEQEYLEQNRSKNFISNEKLRFYQAFKEIELEFIMKLYKKRKEALILIYKSAGTEFDDAKEEVVSLLEKHIRKHLAEEINNIEAEYEDFLYHIFANSFVEHIFETFKHFEDVEDAKKMLDLFAKHYFYGVNYFIK